MNEQAAQALYDAERRGVRQIKRHLFDAAGGRCAMGVIMEAVSGVHPSLVDPVACVRQAGIETIEWLRIVEMNDDHGLTFSEIARKHGPDSA